MASASSPVPRAAPASAPRGAHVSASAVSPALSDAAPTMPPLHATSPACSDASDSDESVATAPPASGAHARLPASPIPRAVAGAPLPPGHAYAAPVSRRPGAAPPIPVPRPGSAHPPRSARSHAALGQHHADLTRAIVPFLAPLLPTEEEYRIKEALRRRLQRLAQHIDPHASLLAFGSMANGFALRNSDMDLCCLVSGAVAHPEAHPAGSSPPPAPPGCDAPPLSSARASELVEQFAQIIREQTDFSVMPLPLARIPIIKIHKRTCPRAPAPPRHVHRGVHAH